MGQIPAFLSLIIVARNQARSITPVLEEAASQLSNLVSDFELVVIDNGSNDDSIEVLKVLTGDRGFPNLQVYVLTKEVDRDIASWVGLESALGDFVAVFDPLTDDLSFLPQMLERAVADVDVVFAQNEQKPKQSLPYRMASACFNSLFKNFVGVHLSSEAPAYRVLSKRVVNFILRHQQPALTYRHLPATGGFSRVNLTYKSDPKVGTVKNLKDGLDKGMRLLASTTRAPMRLVTALSLFGAVANLLYSVYVVVIAVFKEDVAPGWVSLSLQQSGMFFLISLVLMVLGEYILHMASLSNEGPLYHVAQEFTSSQLTRTRKLNVEERFDGTQTPQTERSV